MSDHDAILAEIIADPDDLDVRLVYADLLEEQGQTERATFIRTEGVFSVERLRDWFGVVFASFKGKAAGAAVYLDDPGGWGAIISAVGQTWDLAFHHGFLDGVSLSLADWLMYGPTLVAEQPIRYVRMFDRRPAPIVGGYSWWAKGCTAPIEEYDPDGVPAWLDWDDTVGGLWETFPTEEEAGKALSRYALSWARQERDRLAEKADERGRRRKGRGR